MWLEYIDQSELVSFNRSSDNRAYAPYLYSSLKPRINPTILSAFFLLSHSAMQQLTILAKLYHPHSSCLLLVPLPMHVWTKIACSFVAYSVSILLHKKDANNNIYTCVMVPLQWPWLPIHWDLKNPPNKLPCKVKEFAYLVKNTDWAERLALTVNTAGAGRTLNSVMVLWWSSMRHKPAIKQEKGWNKQVLEKGLISSMICLYWRNCHLTTKTHSVYYI